MLVWPLHGETSLENGDSMSTMLLLSSVCQRIGNTASFFCQHSMHIFIKKGRSVLIQDDTRSAFR